jgi:tricorn protease
VARASGGRIGYLHIFDFGINGYNELEQQFTGQIDKEALIFDARWSNGGWTGSIVAELMDRRALGFHASREKKEVWPDMRWGGLFGPKAVLVNHVTVSAGESFAYFFRKRGIGPLVGSRTWGGSTALNPVPALIDGGYVNVPNAPFYDESGWMFEGHGLDPDVPVEPDPARMFSEGDAQLAAAVRTLMQALSTKAFRPPPLPSSKRTP